MWAIQNFFRWNESPLPVTYMERVVDSLILICETPNVETKSQILWTLSYIVNQREVFADSVITTYGAFMSAALRDPLSPHNITVRACGWIKPRVGCLLTTLILSVCVCGCVSVSHSLSLSLSPHIHSLPHPFYLFSCQSCAHLEA